MQYKPYFCPHCRSNRTKFRLIHKNAFEVQKNAFDGSIISQGIEEPYVSISGEYEVECLVCHFVGYESMFIKAAEKEPRFPTEVQGRA